MTCSGWGTDGEFESSEGLAGVAVCFFGEVMEGVFVGVDVEFAKTAFGVGEGGLRRSMMSSGERGSSWKTCERETRGELM